MIVLYNKVPTESRKIIRKGADWEQLQYFVQEDPTGDQADDSTGSDIKD